MRYLMGFVLFLLALGTLRMVGCGDADPCGGCDDGNPCTIEQCVFVVWSTRGDTGWQCDLQLVHEDGTPCGSSGCGGSGNVCVSGVCRENLCAGCMDDGNPCTYCSYSTGACNVPRAGGTSCTGESGHTGRCSEDGVCIVCEELDCDDGDLCTTDHCREEYGGGYVCEHYPVSCDHQCAFCDPETGGCDDSLAEGYSCTANYELGISGWHLLGTCESGRCTGQPCDLTSEERYPCPVEDWIRPEQRWICCPWEHLPDHPRGYCTVACTKARCLAECPSEDMVRDCLYKAYGDCAIVEYCHAECAGLYYQECLRLGGVCPEE